MPFKYLAFHYFSTFITKVFCEFASFYLKYIIVLRDNIIVVDSQSKFFHKNSNRILQIEIKNKYFYLIKKLKQYDLY